MYSIRRAAFRTAFPRVSSWCDAERGDSLLEFHAHRWCVHAWGVARARHSRVSLRNGPLRAIPDSLCSPQGFEMRVADEGCAGPITVSRQSKIGSHPPHANMHRCDRIPKVSIQPAPSHHRSPTRSHTVRRHGVGPHHRFSTVENRSQQLPAQTCVQASV